MKKIFLISLLFLSFVFLKCSSPENSFTIILNNPVDVERIDEYLSLDINSVKEKYPDFNTDYFSIYDNETEIPYQLYNQQISFVIYFQPLEEKTITVKFKSSGKSKKEFKSRTYAEIAMKVDYEFKDGKHSGGRFQNYDSVRVPDNHTDHNALFKYEGPGWESDKVGYRYYIDWRNRTDIFGKKTNELVLKNVGVNDLEAKDDSYHQMQDWGMDIFKVGSSFGIGSYGLIDNDSVYMVSERDSVICKIRANGPVKAEVTTDYYGWKAAESIYDLKSVLSIVAGSRLTKVELEINNPANLITGLAKSEFAEFFESKSDGEWSYIALFGKQSLADDNLGIALFYNDDEFVASKETEDSYTVILYPDNSIATYYFCAAWEQEPNGIKTKEEFITYLNNTIERLNNPVTVLY